MKKMLSLLLSTALLLSMTACGDSTPTPPEGMLASSGVIEFNRTVEPYPEDFEVERPSADEELEGQSTSSSSEAPSSSSKAPSSSSEAPSSSSKAPSSSSEAPSSSSEAPSSSSKAPSSSSEASSSSSKASSSSSKASSSSSSSKRTSSSAVKSAAATANPNGSKGPRNEMRAVWISYLDFNTLLKNQDESSFRRNMNREFASIKRDGFNTVFVQVRPFGDALYKSSFFPWSHTITGKEGRDPGFDPLEILVQMAHNHDLKIEAWINPYRIRNGNVNADMDPDSLAYYWLEEGSGEVIEYEHGIYFNPANEQARNLIVDGVTEIVEKYDVDGIHFDDYFYPTTDAAFDKADYDAYKSDGGKLGLAAWRRRNVDLLVQEVYSAVKSTDRNVRFGISPQGNNDINYDSQYIDVAKWLKNPGYVDYICPQIYYGFDNSTCPFAETVKYWNKLIKRDDIDLYVGLSASKIGLEDKWAGDGKDEWKNSTNLLARMVAESRKSSHYQGFAVFRFSSLYQPASGVAKQVEKEKDALCNILD